HPRESCLWVCDLEQFSPHRFLRTIDKETLEHARDLPEPCRIEAQLVRQEARQFMKGRSNARSRIICRREGRSDLRFARVSEGIGLPIRLAPACVCHPGGCGEGERSQ